MKNNQALLWIAVIVGVLLIALGVYYLTHTAESLPSYLPGHEAGSTAVHTKHAIAAFLLGVACFVFTWFQSGSKKKENVEASGASVESKE